MRAASFVTLRDLVGLIAEYPQGLRAMELDHLARQMLVRTHEKRNLSRTTLYHYRNILLHLGVFIRRQRRYLLNYEHPIVLDLLRIMSPGSLDLSLDERRFFSQLVMNNANCRHHFFDLFMPESYTSREYDLEAFITFGRPVAWKRESRFHSEGRSVHLRNVEAEGRSRWLRTEDEVQAILYGVRYWARDELGFIDELFMEDLGGVMFPVKITGPIPDPDIVTALLGVVDPGSEWTTLSVRDLSYRWMREYHVPRDRIFQTLLEIYGRYSNYVVLIATSESFATITATSRQAEEYQLRSYMRDYRGRYISHIRVHRGLKEVLRWSILSHA